MSAGRGRPTHLERVFAQYIQPVAMRIVGLCKRASTAESFVPWTLISSRRLPWARLFITF